MKFCMMIATCILYKKQLHLSKISSGMTVFYEPKRKHPGVLVYRKIAHIYDDALTANQGP